MEQSWWVYAVIAFGCLVMYLVVKLLESKVMKDADVDLTFVSFILALIGFFAAYKAAVILKLFE